MRKKALSLSPQRKERRALTCEAWKFKAMIVLYKIERRRELHSF